MPKPIIYAGFMALLTIGLVTPTDGFALGPFAARMKDRKSARFERGTQQADTDRQSIMIGGTQRHYVLRIPPTAKQHAQKDLPLVIVLHGGGGNAKSAELMSGFTKKGAREGFYVVYPDGTGKQENFLLTWNATHCCGLAMRNHADDVEFISELIDHLERQYSIDSRRIYVTGMSNGAMMTNQLGAALSNKIAAIAPVVGGVFGDESMLRAPVSAMIFNGLQDTNVPYAGGIGGGPGARSGAWDGTPLQPALAQGQFWAKANHCNMTPAKSETPTLITYTYHCPGKNEVQQVIIKDGGHSWPGGNAGRRRGADQPSAAINATDAMWAFFKAHPKS